MARRKRSKTPLTSSHGSSITWLLRVSPMTKPSLQNLKLATSNGNYVNCNRSQNKWAIPLCAPPLNLQFLERGRAGPQAAGVAHTPSRNRVLNHRVQSKVKRVAVLGWASYARLRRAVGFSEESIREARTT